MVRKIACCIVKFLRDLLILIIGVALGIQGNEIFESSQRKGDEVKFLKSLAADLDKSMRQNEQKILNMTRYAEDASFIIETLQICENLSEQRDRIAAGLFVAGKFNAPYFAQGTYNELLATGSFQTIQSDDVRDQLLNTVQTVQSFEQLDSQVISRIAPHIAYIESQIFFDIRSPISGSAEVNGEVLMGSSLQGLCDDPRFISALAATRSMTYTIIQATSDVVALQKELDISIAGELRVREKELRKDFLYNNIYRARYQ